MPLPKEISPNPLLASTVELRITTGLEPGRLFSKLYPFVADEFPEMKPGQVSNDIKKADPERFKYAADFVVRNENYSLSISDNSIAFENVNEYSLWGNYFPFIKTQLSKLFATNIIKEINRVGVRYVSVFPDSLNDILEYQPKYSFADYEQQDFSFIRTTLKIKDIKIHLQIFKNAKVEKNDIVKNGCAFDIEAYSKMFKQPDESIFSIINTLHEEQKILFFKLLKPSFVSSLNPKY